LPKKVIAKGRIIFMNTDGLEVSEYNVLDYALKSTPWIGLYCTCGDYQRQPDNAKVCTHVLDVYRKSIDTTEPLPQYNQVIVTADPFVAVGVAVLEAPNTHGGDGLAVKKAIVCDTSNASASMNTMIETGSFLGFVMPGEGRRQLRDAVIAWVVEQAALGKLPDCNAAHHRPRLKSDPKEILDKAFFNKADKVHVGNAATLLTTGWCLRCWQDDVLQTVPED